MNSDPKNTVKDYLKNKVEAKKTPPESADEFIKRKLLEEPKDFDASQRSFWNRFRTRFQGLSNKMFFFRRKPFKRFMNETFPIVSFITFSCYVVLMMEEKYSEMRDKITASKSFKQMQIEQEDEEIKNALFGENSNSPKTPIVQKSRKQKYKFEYFDEDESEDETGFTTKSELLEKIYLDSLKGESIPTQYLKELKEYVKNKKEAT